MPYIIMAELAFLWPVLGIVLGFCLIVTGIVAFGVIFIIASFIAGGTKTVSSYHPLLFVCLVP